MLKADRQAATMLLVIGFLVELMGQALVQINDGLLFALAEVLPELERIFRGR